MLPRLDLRLVPDIVLLVQGWVVVPHIDKHLQQFEADLPPPTVVPMMCAFCPMSADHHHGDPDHNGADVVEYQFCK